MRVLFRSSIPVLLAALTVSEATAQLEGSVRQVFIDEFMQTCLSGQRTNPDNRFLPEYVLQSFCRCNANIIANRLRESDIRGKTGLTAEENRIGYEIAHYCRDNLSGYLESPGRNIQESPQDSGQTEREWRPTGSIGGAPVNSILKELHESSRLESPSPTPRPATSKPVNRFLQAIDEMESAQNPGLLGKTKAGKPEKPRQANRFLAEIERQEQMVSPWSDVDLRDPEERIGEIHWQPHSFWDPMFEPKRHAPGARSMALTGESNLLSPDASGDGGVDDTLRTFGQWATDHLVEITPFLLGAGGVVGAVSAIWMQQKVWRDQAAN